MLFVPKRSECSVWNTYGDSVFINWRYNPTPESNNTISFKWNKSPQTNDFSDPFYLSVIDVLKQNVLPCSLNACECQPQLRYNNIIKKWFCNCSSSALSTKNNDLDEINELLKWAKGEYTEEKGFFDNPIKAILYWNIAQADDYKKISEYLMEHPTEDSSAYFEIYK